MKRFQFSAADLRWPWQAMLLTMLFMLTACGGGGGGSTAEPLAGAASDETGTLIISLTDAEGDFVSYTVDVVSIHLETAAGRVVEALPLNTRVDFAELTEVTELLTIATVPAGVYESVSLTLDYTKAEILVQDAQGAAVSAQARGEAGALLGEVTVRLNLTSADYVRIRRGIPAAFSLDFDLDASNDIDLTVDPVVVTVAPFLLATPELETDREHRVRGVLADVDSAAMEITLNVRPFWRRSGDFGRFVLQVVDDTAFEVDGQSLDAAEGLAAVADLSLNSPVVAHGMIVQGEFVADTVIAGTSVPWSHADVVAGVVTARTGDTLTVQGARIHHANGTRLVRDGVEVTIGAETGVTAPGAQGDAFTSQSISVGQRVVAFGVLRGDDANPVLDATQGRVRMRISSFSGEVIEADPLVVDLHLLNGRRPENYDFAGTGSRPADDADPDNYQVLTAALGLAQLQIGEVVRVRGLVNEFGAAPDDFLARTVIDPAVASRPALFVAGWPEPVSNAVTDISDLSVTLDLSAARSLLHIFGWRHDLDVVLESMRLVAPPTGRGVYALRVRGEGAIHLYRNFADLSAQLLLQLDTGSQLKRVAAHGRYNTSRELETKRASFELIPTVD